MIDLWMVDLDGVMNSSNLRDALVPSGAAAHTAEGWAAWHEAHTTEAVNEEMIDRLNAAHKRGIRILFCSMRCTQYADTTHQQLTSAGLDFDPVLWLRSPWDDTPPPAAKVFALLNACAMFTALGEAVQITFIDDSTANIMAINASADVAAVQAGGDVSVLPVLFPVFKGVE